MIRLACPNCDKKLAVEDASAGTICKCPTCASKFRVPDAAPAPPAPVSARSAAPKRSSAQDSASSQRDSAGRSSAARRAKSAPAPKTNGIVLDQLETVDDEEEVRPRRKSKSRRREPTPSWVYMTTALAGMAFCGLLIAAFFFKLAAISLIVIGLPFSLLGRRWRQLGIIGVTYLLSGAGLFIVHNGSWLKPLEGPPAEGATAQEVDTHCARLLKGSGELDASSWVGAEKPTDSSQIRGLRGLVEEAYKAGAAKVCVANPDRVDNTGLPFPDLIVVLPDDDKKKEVIAWYRRISAGKRVPAPGEKYLYIDY
jgi:hypothetical protein